MVAVAVRLWGRARGATPLARRMFIPVLVIAILFVVLLGAGIVIRAIDDSTVGLAVVSWLLALAVPALALAFLVGFVRWRLFAAQAMLRLASCLPAMDAAGLRRAFAEAFRDPDVDIVFPADDAAQAWLDASGQNVAAPAPGSGRMLSPVSDGDRIVAAHRPRRGAGLRARAHARRHGHRGDGAGQPAPGGRGASGDERGASLPRPHRRDRRSRAPAHRARPARRRPAAAGGAAHRAGARRGHASAAIPSGASCRLHELGPQLDEAHRRAARARPRRLPAVLADRGLAEALRAVAARSGVPLDVSAHASGRYPPEVESTVYFCMLEALQNVLKHAVGCTGSRSCSTDANGELSFTVRDDGAGAATWRVAPGAGWRTCATAWPPSADRWTSARRRRSAPSSRPRRRRRCRTGSPRPRPERSAAQAAPGRAAQIAGSVAVDRSCLRTYAAAPQDFGDCVRVVERDEDDQRVVLRGGAGGGRSRSVHAGHAHVEQDDVGSSSCTRWIASGAGGGLAGLLESRRGAR